MTTTRTRRRTGARWPLRVCVPSLATVALFGVVIFVIVIPTLRHSTLDRKKEMIQHLTESAWSQLDYYHGLELSGELTREAAQAQAVAHIRHMHYGPEMSDYFWIHDMQSRMIMHPYRPDLEGRDISGFADSGGKLIFQTCTDVVRAHGEGYVDYTWQRRPDDPRIVAKLSYVKGFAPWDWVIGTGVYLEDIDAEVAALSWKLLRWGLAILAVISALLLLIVTHVAHTERRRLDAEHALREREQRLETIFNSVQAGILVVDADSHEIVDANSAALSLLGSEKHDVVGHVCHSRVCPAEQGHCPVSDYGQTIDNSERLLVRADGRRLAILKTVARMELNGRPVLLESFVDISEQKAAEQELTRRVEEISEAKRRLEVLVSNIVGREQRMVELKHEVNELLHELGRRPKYQAPDETAALRGAASPRS